MSDCEWNQATHALGYKAVDTSAIGRMFAQCPEQCTHSTEWWDVVVNCDRLPDHTGRHLALELRGRYPIGVWR